MIFTKNTLFILLLSLLALVNVLILGNINIFHVETFLVFLFLIFVPGFLLMLIFKIYNMELGEYVIYSVGMSVAFLMVVGVLCNETLLLFDVRRPLELIPLLVSFDIAFSILLSIAYFRIHKLHLSIQIPSRNLLNTVFFIIPAVFPVISILGATSLNNYGTSYITLSVYGLVALYIIFFVFLHKKLSSKLYPWNLYFLSLTLIFTGSLRSWFIASTDATLEYGLGNFVFQNGYWDYWEGGNNYFGMLSIVMLPIILSHFLDSSLLLVQKVAFPIIFCFLPVALYYLFNKLTKNLYAFLGVLFFIVQPTFAVWNLFPPRQEIAFLFLSLMYLTFFTNKLTDKMKVVLFSIFSFCVITSHYSTTFILTILFPFVYVVAFFFQTWKIYIKKVSKKAFNEKFNLNLFGVLIIVFLLLEAVWYFGVTDIGHKAVNLRDSVSANAFSLDKSPLNYIVKRLPITPEADLANYVQRIKKLDITTYSDSAVNKYPSSIKETSVLTPVFNHNLLYGVFEKIKILLLGSGFLLILVGLFLYAKKHSQSNKFYVVISFVSLATLAMLVQLPFLGGFYDPIRLYQQLLLILAVFPIFALTILKVLNNSFKVSIYAVFIALYLLFLSHVPYYFIGGNRIQLNVANAGKDYDFSYTTADEIYSMNWLLQHKPKNNLIALDNYAQFKLYQSPYYNLSGKVKLEVLPAAMNDQDYVYATRTNIKQGITFKYGGNGLLIYNFPIEFLNENKDVIYTNKGSTVFK